ncbi:MAG: hypothetical protein JXA38_05145 [Methanosarcinaceae archaeon]|nr:hypothetical protein [Methanosarcinaceae archaeon]
MNPQEDPFKTPAEVREWCERMTLMGRCPEFEDWPKSLFGLGGYEENINFLIERFRTTSNMKEYYFCIPYLFKDIEKEVLFVPWHKSPNFKKLVVGDTNTCLETKPLNGGCQRAPEGQSRRFNHVTQRWW